MRFTPRAVARRLRHRGATTAVHLRHAATAHRSDIELLTKALGASSIHVCLDRIRGGRDSHFFITKDTAAAVARRLDEVMPGWKDRSTTSADRVAGGEVRLLGDNAVRLATGAPNAVPWHEDVISGYRWSPRTFYKNIEIPAGRADIKVPWELSRCQHLPGLGIAYVASGDERYVAMAISQVESWMATNPRGYGVNWACTMDVAIRAVNWLWAIHLVAGSPLASDDFFTRVLASLYVHGVHIVRNLEIYAGGLTTNHTLANYVGLLYLGLLFGKGDGDEWCAIARAGIEQCMSSQVHEDGVDFENSIPYHRLVLEMFSGAHVLCERAGCPLSDAYRRRLERMFDFVLHYTRPDGLAPVIGDGDDGRLQILHDYFGWDPQDHRYLLAVGAVLLGRSDFASLSAGAPGALDEVGWLLGVDAMCQLRQLATENLELPGTRAFRPSGRYVMRHGEEHAVICADEVGTRGLGNHKHNDIFSFELSMRCQPVVVDAGSFVYTRDPALRDEFRATTAHSTVTIDDREQNDFAGPFEMRRDARLQVNTWSTLPAYDYLDASHDGYMRLTHGVVHRRRFLLLKAPPAWLIVDSLRGAGRHVAKSFIHFAPTGVLRRDEGCRITTEVQASIRAAMDVESGDAGASFVLDVTGAPWAYRAADVTVTVFPLGHSEATSDVAWHSPRFGKRVEAPLLCLTRAFEAECTFGYLMVAL